MPKAKHEYQYISLDDFERVVKPCFGTRDELYAVLWTLQRYRGLTPLEACKRRIQELHEDMIQYDRPKQHYYGAVYLPQVALDRLARWIENNKFGMRNGYLFQAHNSRLLHISPSTSCRKWRLYCRKAGLKSDFWVDPNPAIPNAGRRCYLLRQYDLRSSFLTDMQLKHGDIFKTMVMARHTDIRSTIPYLRRAVLAKEKDLLQELY